MDSSAPVVEQRDGRSRVVELVGTLAGGAFMGAAEIVPGVSGGTIALVFGIYDSFVGALSDGAGVLAALVRGQVADAVRRFKAIDWPFVVALGVGMAATILALTSVLDHLLETQPVVMSALFAGLVLGSAWLARRELHRPLDVGRGLLLTVVAVVTFIVLGATSTADADPALLLYAGAAAIAICAMVLPGISGSFVLLLLGMYQPVITAVSDRDLTVVAVFGLGAVAGLAVFSRLLDRMLTTHHDTTLAALIGLMVGSLRVLWPWPAGPEGVGDAALGAPVSGELAGALVAALGGLVLVLVIAKIGDVTGQRDDHEQLHPPPDAAPRTPTRDTEIA